MSIEHVKHREVPERMSKEEAKIGWLRENLARERAFVMKQLAEITRLTNQINSLGDGQ